MASPAGRAWESLHIHPHAALTARGCVSRPWLFRHQLAPADGRLGCCRSDHNHRAPVSSLSCLLTRAQLWGQALPGEWLKRGCVHFIQPSAQVETPIQTFSRQESPLAFPINPGIALIGTSPSPKQVSKGVLAFWGQVQNKWAVCPCPLSPRGKSTSHLAPAGGWQQREPVSRWRSLPLPRALRLGVAPLVEEQESPLAKGLVAAGAPMPAWGLAAGCGGGVVTKAVGGQLGGK